MLAGYEFYRYCRYLQRSAGQADVVVFGHTHRAENRMENGVVFFNPGSAGPNHIHGQPSFGVLRIQEDGKVRGEIHYLENYPVKKKHWQIP